eukprot:TRINITY_DN65601_c0_g1_i1.p1 TRINITY_DN65601_c0_g1~~TRINITY_DN65601_c0_g1_i1.p1  ORF type:complete len:156 (-),score=30.57 TRINITY_DN65601_c0_g1_i1:273-740(-)
MPASMDKPRLDFADFKSSPAQAPAVPDSCAKAEKAASHSPSPWLSAIVLRMHAEKQSGQRTLSSQKFKSTPACTRVDSASKTGFDEAVEICEELSFIDMLSSSDGTTGAVVNMNVPLTPLGKSGLIVYRSIAQGKSRQSFVSIIGNKLPRVWEFS